MRSMVNVHRSGIRRNVNNYYGSVKMVKQNDIAALMLKHVKHAEFFISFDRLHHIAESIYLNRNFVSRYMTS